MRLLSYSIAFIALATGHLVAEEKDAIRTDLDKAKTAHAASMTKARTAFLAAFDETIKAVAQTGDLDAVKALQAERKDYDEGGKLPKSSKMAAAALEYTRATKLAKSTLDKAYDEAVKEYTKALKIEQAEAVRKEWKEADGLPAPKKAPVPKVVKQTTPVPKAKWMTGTWKITYTPDRATRTYRVEGDGTLTFEEAQLRTKIKEQNGMLIADFDDGPVERLTFAGGRLFVEHFSPKTNLEKNVQALIGIGEPAKKR